MNNILGESEANIVFGDFYGVLRNKAIYALPQLAKDFAEKLLKTEHAVLVGFIWFIMNQKENYIFELPKIDLDIPYDCNELIKDLKNQFWWSGIDPISEMDYNDEIPILSPEYVRLRNPARYFSTVDIYLSFSGDGATDFSDYKREAKKFFQKETHKVLKIPLPYLEEPEGRVEEIEKIMTKKNFYRIEELLPLVDLETDQPLIPAEEEKKLKEEEKRQELEDFAGAKKRIGLLVRFGYKPGFVFVDPRLIEDAELDYSATKENLRRKYGWDVLKSPGDLILEFLTDNHEEITYQWKDTVNEIFESLIKELNERNRAEFSKYEKEARRRIHYWNRLDNQSKDFLSFGEFLFDHSENVGVKDFSQPASLYCKTLENEIKKKLFGKFVQQIGKWARPDDFKKDLNDKDVGEFAKKIIKGVRCGKLCFSLGQMSKYLELTFECERESWLLQKFRQFIENFKREPSFWKEISKEISGINQKYRNNAIHEILSETEAKECRNRVSNVVDNFLKSRVNKNEEEIVTGCQKTQK